MKKSSIRFVAVVILVVMTAVFLAGTVRGIAGAESEVSAGARITVSGKGVVSVDPDAAYIRYGVNTFDISPSAAAERNAEIMDRVNNALFGAGARLEDIRTEGYNIYPEYNYYEGRSVLKGYTVQNYAIVVSDDTERVGKLLDILTAAGANYIGGVEFVNTKSGAYEFALAAAANDAWLKARQLADGRTIRLVEISERESGGIITSFAVRAEAYSQTPISSGKCDITAVVSAEYEII